MDMAGGDASSDCQPDEVLESGQDPTGARGEAAPDKTDAYSLELSAAVRKILQGKFLGTDNETTEEETFREGGSHRLLVSDKGAKPKEATGTPGLRVRSRQCDQHLPPEALGRPPKASRQKTESGTSRLREKGVLQSASFLEKGFLRPRSLGPAGREEKNGRPGQTSHLPACCQQFRRASLRQKRTASRKKLLEQDLKLQFLFADIRTGQNRLGGIRKHCRRFGQPHQCPAWERGEHCGRPAQSRAEEEQAREAAEAAQESKCAPVLAPAWKTGVAAPVRGVRKPSA
ncbi:uncharacterized protein LOC112995534 [Dromaius novaehollandiae]|uniref:uncharacterized protein LOC112995534 n=1 Tax=Dromaius novaehollandiae TaxID=8790 RepID=UPI00311D6D07